MSSLIADNGTNITLIFNNASASSGGQGPLGVSASGSGSAFSEDQDEISGFNSTDLSGESGALDVFSGGSTSGSGSASDSGSGSISGSGSTSGVVNASGDGSGDIIEQYTASALLQVSAEDGGIQCSDIGQYECIAGILSPQAGGIINVTVSVAIAGKLKLMLARC